MMKLKLVYGLLIVVLSPSACLGQQKFVDEAFSHAQQQTQLMLKEIEQAEKQEGKKLVSPRSLTPAGELQLVPSKDWTSGFFPGVLWYLYDYSGEDVWLSSAREFTARIEQEKLDAGTHDMGFKVYCSFGNGYRITEEPYYREVIIESAQTLTRRFNPAVGAIRSWDHNSDKWDFPVIIDNMMNLELLFAATRLTGDSTYYNIAVSHANTTLHNHFREDYSTYHVIGYDPGSGEVLKKNTHQGYSHESAWARGQAWGLYGYTMCYRETGHEPYLQQAEKIAAYMLNHPNMPEDLVPYWDFDAPEIPDEPRDASAAAVMAAALYELSTYSDEGKMYRQAADKVLRSLSENYTSEPGENKGFILLHSTGSKPHNIEINVPLIYSDYYYLEALLRKQTLDDGNKLF
jgi:unsaturated chondroitin disaccharide hydrolase